MLLLMLLSFLYISHYYDYRSYQPLLDAVAARGLRPEGLRADAWCVGHTGSDCDPTERVSFNHWSHFLPCHKL